MQGRTFIRRTDEKKQIIELRNTKQFAKLYKRIANDLINILQKQQRIDFYPIFTNYKSDYIFLFRNIYQDVCEAGFGFEIRKQFNFNKNNIIEIKAEPVSKEEQEIINDYFDIEYTKLLNNDTETLVNNEFIQSEAKYFESIYNNSIQDYTKYKDNLQKELQQTQGNLLELSILLGLTQIQREKERILQTRQEAISKQLQDIQQNENKEILKQFKNKIEEKIDIRSQSNTEYGTGQATSKIKELEYSSIKTLGVLANRVQKIWWEKSQFIFGATPRHNHLAISGSQANSQGDFQVSIYQVPYPRHTSLPPEESARCRCEIEYVVS